MGFIWTPQLDDVLVLSLRPREAGTSAPRPLRPSGAPRVHDRTGGRVSRDTTSNIKRLAHASAAIACDSTATRV